MKNNLFKSVKNLCRVYGQKLSYLTNLNLSRPSNYILTLTNRCNFCCPNCAVWRLSSPKELNIVEWKEIIKKIKNWSKFGNVILNGGEPLLKNDLFKIINFIDNKRFYITLNTNGSLIDKSMAQKLVVSNLNEIKISLYSLNEKIHDKLRGYKGAYAKAMFAINNLLKTKLNQKKETVISIAVLINSLNLKEIVKIITWAAKKGLVVVLQSLDEELEIQQLHNYKINWWRENIYFPKEKIVIKRIFDKVISLKKENYPISNSLGQIKDIRNYYLNPEKIAKNLPCFVGYQNIIINPDGRVRFCFRGNLVGDINKEDFRQINRSIKSKEERKKIKNCPLSCRIANCNYTDNFNDRFKQYINRLRSEK